MGTEKNTATPKVDDKRGVAQKLTRLRHGLGLTIAALADLAGISPSSVNQIERGLRRASEETLEPLGEAVGIEYSDWRREWTWERFIYATLGTYQHMLDIDYTRPLRLSSDKSRAHECMIEKNWYRYILLDDAAEHHLDYSPEHHGHARAKLPWKMKPKPQYSGGAMQSVIFQTTVHSLDDLVLDAHSGEEVLTVVEGEMDFVLMAQPSGELLNFRGDREYASRPAQVRLEEKTILRILESLQQEDAVYDTSVAREWLKTMQKSLSDTGVVPCEIVHLPERSIIKYRSDWPHGAMVANPSPGKNYVRSNVVTVGSYLAGNLEQEPQEGDSRAPDGEYA